MTDGTHQKITELIDRFAQRHHVPVVGVGLAEAQPMTFGMPDMQFRIASMTKSFTAAAVLLLRDDGHLALDDPIAAYIPQLASLRSLTSDSPAVTIRQLVTMSSGIATDDPWADRQLDASDSRMDALFSAGATFAAAPGTAFHYSNYGYAMLGRLVTNVSGDRYQEFVTERLLQPLGLARTTWEPIDEHHAVGHVWRDARLIPEPPPLGDGGFASMGGLWSTVADIARWVHVMLDAFPPRDADDAGPLRRATRREMQQVARSVGPRVKLTGGERLDIVTGGYGGGLNVLDDSTLGRVVTHSGGLPGFGSNMRWLPDRAIGVVALANLRYAPMHELTQQILQLLSFRDELPLAHKPVETAVLRRACDALGSLLVDWDDAAAVALFTDNVGLDEPFDRRRRAAFRLADDIGTAVVDDASFTSGASAEFTLRGTTGSARVTLSLASGPTGGVQHYDWTIEG